MTFNANAVGSLNSLEGQFVVVGDGPENQLYASNNGSNVTGIGTLYQPYADPYFATTEATPSGTVPAIIYMSPGIYNASSLELRPLVSYSGTVNSTMVVGPSPITLASSWSAASNGHFTSFYGTSILAEFLLDFSTFTASDLGIQFYNAHVTGGFEMIGPDTNRPYVLGKNTSFQNEVLLKSCTADFYSCILSELVCEPKGAGTGDIVLSCNNCTIGSDVSLTGASGRDTLASFRASPIVGTLTIDSTFVTVDLDEASYPAGGIIYSGGATSAQVTVRHGTAAATDAQNLFTKSQAVAPVALTSTAGSIATNAALSNNFTHTMTENTTLANPTNKVNGAVYTWVFTQAAAAKTLAFGTDFTWPGGTPLTISTGSGDVDIITGYYDGVKIRTVITGQAFS